MAKKELLLKRTYKAKHFDNGDGSFTMRGFGGHIHYKKEGVMTDVDFNNIEDMGTYWKMTKASYNLYVNKDFSANQLIRFDNKYEGANHKIYYEPKKLVWMASTDLSDMVTFRNQQAVTGVLTRNVIRYTDAFGDGIHFEITFKRSGFTKEIVIDAKNKLELPPTAQHKLVALFRYQGDGLKILKRDRSSWNKDSYFESEDGFAFEEEAKATAKSFIRPAYIFDAGDGVVINKQKIKVFWKQRNGSLWQAKVLPTRFLKNAVYPVRADTTTDFDATTADGYFNMTNGNWNTIYSATTAGGWSDIATNSYGLIFDTISSNRVYQTMHPCDTSSLGAGAVITASSFFIYPTAVLKASTHYWDVCDANPTDPTAIVAGDFNNWTRTAIGGNITNDVTTGAYHEMVYTSYTHINKTGTTTVALSGRGMISNTSPSNSQNAIQIDYADGTNSPYIEITYTSGTHTTITAVVGAFILTGIANTLTRTIGMVASAGSFVLTGIAVIFATGKGMVADAGSFVLTGINASFSLAVSMIASVGTFTLTGIAVAFVYFRGIVAETGTFVLTGFSAFLTPSKIWFNTAVKTTIDWFNPDSK